MQLSIADLGALFGIGVAVVGAVWMVVAMMLRAERERAEERFETKTDASERGEAVRRDFGVVLAQIDGTMRELSTKMDLLLEGRIRTGGTNPPGRP